MAFKLKTLYKPSGDQPKAIEQLLSNLDKGHKEQIVIGATGTGKTFTISNIIHQLNKKTLIIVHNKTLAGQLFNELKTMFPDNKVEYFISYFDYYQPEAYVVRNDTYIEKDSLINDEIDKMRHSAINSLINHDDVIVVSSVSCIYGVGDIENYKKSILYLEKGMKYLLKELVNQLVGLNYQRNDYSFKRGTFRLRGDMIDIVPSSDTTQGIRIIFWDDEVEEIKLFNTIDGVILANLEDITIFPASLYATDKEKLEESILRIQQELTEQIAFFKDKNQLVEAQKIEMKTKYDLEMLQELGYCNGIENYSRHLSLKAAGETPTTLIDYFGDDFLTIIDESHVTVSQIRGMYEGDFSRKNNLVQYGFRLPSALDNRPLRFPEFEKKMDKIIYLSATPGDYELNKNLPIVEQIIRPTFVLDPIIEVRPTKNQIENLYFEIKKRAEKNERTLVSTITIKMSEDLTSYLKDLGIKVAYLHSEIKSLERLVILEDLMIGTYDCLIGVNLLREGLDLPVVSLVAILDADKQGFLRNKRSLIQTIGRAARNINGKAILYGDVITDAMREAIEETQRRRTLQEEYNRVHHVQPTPIIKTIVKKTIMDKQKVQKEEASLLASGKNQKNKQDLKQLQKSMKEAAKQLNFEQAVIYRDLIKNIKKS
ncbi:excinuclease ABC subunit UvrB [Candidatus Phytoplasma pruni]|uniref:UvrABC system protein B n=1 Tax=Candidatus Phytoplasma pruni TaxID=479893 RepID=A0A851HD72_9MOLU|nr:excinuclease ABC subunit UvrB [Candidatus Phytoplasma pruni]NWN45928.1 excinuclease ABC subunit UvrB [Candidatus Phytoplasma pruni]